MDTLFPNIGRNREESLTPLVPLFETETTPPTETTIKGDTCPNCNEKDCLDETDIVVCVACGHIVGRIYNNGAEYRYFSTDDRGSDPTRVGAPQDPSLPQASLGTIILGGSHGKSAKTMYKIRKYHTWNTVPYRERVRIQAHERLHLIGLNYGINMSAIDNARNMFIVLQDVGGRQGLSRDSLLAGSLYLVLKESGSPRKPKEIADAFGLTSSQFTKALKQMQEVMAVARQRGLLTQERTKIQISSTQAAEYIDVPLNKLPLSRSQMEHFSVICRRVAKIAEQEGLGQENMPPSLAAGCIAFVLKRYEDIDISLAQIAEVAEISIATLQKCLRRLEGAAEILANLARI